jgi:hypothetical protein
LIWGIVAEVKRRRGKENNGRRFMVVEENYF